MSMAWALGLAQSVVEEKARWKEEFAARREARTERMERREAAKKAKAKPPPKAPVSALPGVVAYFYRTLQMLQGVGTLLEVQVSFVQPMAACAKHALLEHSRRQLRASARPTPTPTPLTPPPAEGGTDLELVTGRGKRADLANAQWSANVLARAESIVAGATPPVGLSIWSSSPQNVDIVRRPRSRFSSSSADTDAAAWGES